MSINIDPLTIKFIDIRRYAGEWEAVIEIADSATKQVYCELMKVASMAKPAEKAFQALIDTAKNRISNPPKEMPAMPIDITSKYTPKEMLVKLQTVKDIGKATWTDVETAEAVS